jgi:5-methylcytosine-specific restriction endonuclease McrA
MCQGLEIDHIIPLELGGLDEDANLQALCYTHHKAKTKADIKRIAKARRLRNKKPPDPNRLGQIRSRGFDKSKTKGFDGKVRARQSPPDHQGS